jgi:DNA (cytosine-5)-methyltransferase 1
LLPTPRSRDVHGAGEHGEGGLNLRTVAAGLTLMPTPRATDGDKGGPNMRGSSGDVMLPNVAVAMARTAFEWGEYQAAIWLHQAVLGREAPPPTIEGRGGRPKLSPYFVEWLMMLEEGHVTSVPGISVNAKLRLLGNGVVPAQALAAFRHLFALHNSSPYSREQEAK